MTRRSFSVRCPLSAILEPSARYCVSHLSAIRYPLSAILGLPKSTLFPGTNRLKPSKNSPTYQQTRYLAQKLIPPPGGGLVPNSAHPVRCPIRYQLPLEFRPLFSTARSTVCCSRVPITTGRFLLDGPAAPA